MRSSIALMARELWYPGMAGPLEDFVERLHRQIREFAEAAGVEQAYVEVELADGARFAVESISPEPGYGFLTLRAQPGDNREAPEALIVPLGMIRRIELDKAEDARGPLGFSLPPS